MAEPKQESPGVALNTRVELQNIRPIRIWTAVLIAALGLMVCAPRMLSQSQPGTSQNPAQPPASSDNPFPGSGGQSPQKPAESQKNGAKPDASGQPAADNPFPGETTDAPIIPAEPVPGASPDSGRSSGSGTAEDSADSGRRGSDPNGDPVRSPDVPGSAGDDDGFSSSRAGLSQMPVEDLSDAKPGKSTKNKTREQVIQENQDVGRFYLEQKNWQAAQSRFSAAFALDAENPDSVFGLAEAERHLNRMKQAAEHYKLFLTYDPDGPHAKAARKGLDEAEAALSTTSSVPKTQGGDGSLLK